MEADGKSFWDMVKQGLNTNLMSGDLMVYRG